MRGCVAGSLATVLAVAALGGPVNAHAQVRSLRCGEVIMTDTTLAANVTGCTGHGLVIAADGVTLDLAGHRVAGAASGDAAGIDVEGRSGVTIENGDVRGFEEGIFVLQGQEVTIRGVRVTRAAHGGVLVDRGHDVKIRRNVQRRCGAGIIVTRSDRVSVAGNRIVRSTFGGISIFGSRHVVIAGNVVTGSRTDAAIGIYRRSSHNAVVRNRVSSSGTGIVAADGASHNLITGNLARRDGSGVILDVGTHDNRVIANSIEDSGFEGVAVVASDDNILARNEVARSGRTEAAGGIVIIPLPDDVSQTSDGNLLAGNLAIHNSGEGIIVGGGQAGNALRRNHAYGNSGLGIDAAPGAIDRGGNRAAGNGDPRECVGVSC